MLTGSYMHVNLALPVLLDQSGLADWFDSEYMTKPWHAWYLTSSASVPSFDSNANNIEAFHSRIPNVEGVRMRSSLERVLMASLPSLVQKTSLELFTRQWVWQPSYIPQGLLEVAVQRISNNRLKKICFSPDEEDQRVMFILSRHYCEKYPDSNISTALIQKYVASVQGDFSSCSSKAEAQELAGMMHVVRKDSRYKGATNPGFRCDCKTFMHISLCTCILVAAQYTGWIDLEALAAPVRVVRPAGRPVTKKKRVRRAQRPVTASPATASPATASPARATGGRPQATRPALHRQLASPSGKYSSAVYKRGSKRKKAAYLASLSARSS